MKSSSVEIVRIIYIKKIVQITTEPAVIYWLPVKHSKCTINKVITVLWTEYQCMVPLIYCKLQSNKNIV